MRGSAGRVGLEVRRQRGRGNAAAKSTQRKDEPHSAEVEAEQRRGVSGACAAGKGDAHVVFERTVAAGAADSGVACAARRAAAPGSPRAAQAARVSFRRDQEARPQSAPERSPE
jgi:hypothetical protein